jgi:hypothetical protein
MALLSRMAGLFAQKTKPARGGQENGENADTETRNNMRPTSLAAAKHEASILVYFETF